MKGLKFYENERWKCVSRAYKGEWEQHYHNGHFRPNQHVTVVKYVSRLSFSLVNYALILVHLLGSAFVLTGETAILTYVQFLNSNVFCLSQGLILQNFGKKIGKCLDYNIISFSHMKLVLKTDLFEIRKNKFSPPPLI